MTTVEHDDQNTYWQATNGQLFVGRSTLLAAIETDLTTQPGLPIVVYGPPRIGKTAVLRVIRNGRLNDHILPVYIDLLELVTDSLSMFWWELAEAAANDLSEQGIELPARKRSQFVATPYLAFRDQFLQPLCQLLGDNPRPLFLGDHADMLLTRLHESDNLYAEIEHFLHQPHIGTLLALRQSPETLSAATAALLADAALYPVTPLQFEEALQLMRAPAPFIVVNDVAEYIYELTEGHPERLQTLCYNLRTRQQQHEWQQATVADAVAALPTPEINNGIATAVTPTIPSYAITPLTVPRRPPTPTTDSSARRALPWLIVPLLLMVILLFGILQGLSNNNPVVLALLGQPPATVPALSASTATATPDPTPSVTSEPTLPAALAELATEEAASPTPSMTPTPTLSGSVTPTATPSMTPSPTLMPEIVRTVDNMPMQLVPAGSFIMGSEEGNFIAQPDEFPQHRVSLDAFYMDRYEISVAQYAAFLNTLGTYYQACDEVDCARPRGLAGYTSNLLQEDFGDGTVQYIARAGFANFPINHVSWHGAQAYCAYVGGRLPTEAEWEYAARGRDGRLYPWGNDPPGPNLAIFQSQDLSNLKPVDALPNGASPFGILAMAGSMWEWTADWYAEDAYSNHARRNPTGPEMGLTRVMRGGAWPINNEADRIRTTNRSSAPPIFFSGAIGFRCVLDSATALQE